MQLYHRGAQNPIQFIEPPTLCNLKALNPETHLMPGACTTSERSKDRGWAVGESPVSTLVPELGADLGSFVEFP